MNKKEREAQKHQEDMALTRGLLWVGGAVILEFFLVLVNRYYINYRVTDEAITTALALDGVLRALRWIALIGAAAGVAWIGARLWKQGRCGALPVAVAAACGAVLVCTHVTLTFQDSGVRMLFLLVPAWAVLALVYYLYQREFFLSAMASGLAAMGTWMVRASNGKLLYALIPALGILVVALVAFRLKQGDGVLSISGKEARVMAKGSNYTLIFLSCAVGLAALTVALAAGVAVAYYLIYAMVAWLFVLLVYYTVKMM